MFEGIFFRKVSITERLFYELSELWVKSDRKLTENVFKMKTFRRAFATACKMAKIKTGGLDGFTIHSCRHTTATRLVQGKMPIQLVGKILGHENVNTTFRYLSATDETLREAASILESIQNSSE